MSRPSPGTAIAALALFAALGGTAVAVKEDGRMKVLAQKLELKNGWGKYGGDSLPPRYFMVGDVVHLEGVLYGGTPDAVAFKLPKGARPTGEVRYPAASGPSFHGEVVVTENGAGTVTSAGDPIDYTGLDGISFRAR
jgi:hypothetical protein